MTGDRTSDKDGVQNRGSGPVGRWEIDSPVVADGPALYRITCDSGVLDVNSAYVYLLWCRDFSRTSAVARFDGVAGGFVTGYVRPEAPDTLVVWQVAVDGSHRGEGVAGKMLHHLVDRLLPAGVCYLEATISADNAASISLFSGLARDRSTEIHRSPLFPADLFPEGHLSEDLYRIGPFPSNAAGAHEGDVALGAAAPSHGATGSMRTPGNGR
jgi:diaminobutyrate acetyltransferase